ncbi:MAG: hypothetical protein IK096_02630 [Lachnospiraceae bacterium]|nr:hypothetical protein [Lachnospiraceae bacterium]
MNAMMISPVMMAGMNPNNYLARKDDRKGKKPVRKKKSESLFSMNAASYEPTDPETALREFYTTYGR